MNVLLLNERTLEVKSGVLEDILKNLASFGQILDSPATSCSKASFLTLDYYMFRASGEVVSLAVVTRAQPCHEPHL